MKKWQWLIYTFLFTLFTIGNISAALLSEGMSGAEVRMLQEQLVSCGYLARAVDGEYGATTVKAVQLFQEDHGLAVTGMVDDNTEESIYNATTNHRKGGGLLLAEGNQETLVNTYQQILKNHGFLDGEVDGVYGQDTVNAVYAFQRHQNLPVSGAIDEETSVALNAMDTSFDKVANKDTSRDYLWGMGDEGKDVKRIQEKLKKAGYLTGEADGIYGNDTFNAVQNLQADSGIPVTGMITETTLSKLNHPAKTKKNSSVIKEGISNNKVVKLQNLLLLHGFNPGIVDGSFGKGTKEAVLEMQKQYALPVTGIVDDNVWSHLETPPVFNGIYKKEMIMDATAYTPYDGGGSGYTYSGNKAGKGHAAVDPKVIPIGSILFVEGYGYCIADDIGRTVIGNHIDICVDTVDQAYQWGVRTVKVYLVR